MVASDPPVVDVHNHVLTPEVETLIERHYSRDEILTHQTYERLAGAKSTAHNRTLMPTLRPKMTEASVRLTDMDRMGVDIQVLATFVSQFYYWVDGELGKQLARLQNEWLATMVAVNPERFTAIGTVPMQDASRAVSELDYLVNHLGFRGVQISGNIAGIDLDDPRFVPFFARAEELGVVVQIHPNGWDSVRLDDYFLVNIIGNPLDSTVALTRLIFSGRLKMFPNLKLSVVHGGGFTPFYSSRMDHAWTVRPECREHIDEAPSTYLRRVHFDTMVYTAEQLAALIAFAGVENVMLGTDYPFDMGEVDPVNLVAKLGLGNQDRERLTGRNALSFFGFS